MTALPTTIEPWLAHDALDVSWQFAPGERLIWQGQPDGGVFVTLSQIARFARAVVAIALFFYILNRLWLTIPPLWDVRMIVFAIFLQAVPTEVLLSAWRRRRTAYALTNRRMLIATDVPVTGRRVVSVPIVAGSAFTQIARGGYSSILTVGPAKRWWDLRAAPPQVGFERIAEGEKVFALIRKVQAEG